MMKSALNIVPEQGTDHCTASILHCSSKQRGTNSYPVLQKEEVCAQITMTLEHIALYDRMKQKTGQAANIPIRIIQVICQKPPSQIVFTLNYNTTSLSGIF